MKLQVAEIFPVGLFTFMERKMIGLISYIPRELLYMNLCPNVFHSRDLHDIKPTR